jgi:hypothetical protein
MATEKEANLARNQHADRLAKMGAHSIAVDSVKQAGKKTFGVIAYVQNEQDAGGFPSHLSLKIGNKELQVPLQTKVSSPFKAE